MHLTAQMVQVNGDLKEYTRDGTIKGLDRFPHEAWVGDSEPVTADFDIHGPHRLKNFNKKEPESLEILTESENGSVSGWSNLDVKKQKSSEKKSKRPSKKGVSSKSLGVVKQASSKSGFGFLKL